MKIELKHLSGSWDDGYALAKHSVSSTYLGQNEFGHPRFETTRSEPGEALYQLKYQSDWTQVDPLATAIATYIVPRLPDIGLIVPVPASNYRARQPVTEIAIRLGQLIRTPVFEKLIRATIPSDAVSLKNLSARADKDAALAGRFAVDDVLEGHGPWNALLVDDLFDSGASMNAVCAALRSYPKIGRIYVAAVSWT